MEIYLDNSATTRVFPEVAELMTKIMCEDYGNPSSLHVKGMQAEQYLRGARDTFARILKVNEKEIFFTSGGTESDNLALIGCARANARRGKHLVTTQIEHPAVLNTMRYLESVGYQVTYLPVNAHGLISLEDLQRAVTQDTILVSIMHTNNEIGALEPVAEAAAVVKRRNPLALFHVDAVQGFGKAKIYPKRMGIDLLSVSGHKIHGPKGIGLLYIDERVKIQPILYGGGQQKNLRSGTDNVPGIAGFAKAAQLLYDHYEDDVRRLYQCKKYFMDGIRRLEGRDDQRTAAGRAGRRGDGSPHRQRIGERRPQRSAAARSGGGGDLRVRGKRLRRPQAPALGYAEGHRHREAAFGIHDTLQLFGIYHAGRIGLYIEGYV